MRFPRWRRRRHEDLDDEIQSHLRMAVRDRTDRGETAEQAESSARREFGNVGLVKEITREMWGWGSLDRIAQDARYGLRLLRKNPGFTAVAVLSLAIGIGALTTVFALINALELKPLPVFAPDALVSLEHPSFSYPVFRELRARGPMFDGLFAWQLRTASVGWGDETESVSILSVTGDFYSTLGVRAALGRMLEPADDDAGAARAVAVLSHATWRRRYGGNLDAVGRPIAINGAPFTIVGVAPPGFFGVAVGTAPEVTIPVGMAGRMRPGQPNNILQSVTTSWLHIMGRLRPGWSLAQADAAFQVIWSQTLEATVNPGQPPTRRARYLARTTALVPARNGYSFVRNQFSEPLWLLLALVGLLLLVACAAVANLLLARGCMRQRELAVRLAVGASGGRLMRQLLVEGLLLSLLGSAAGVSVATWSARLLVGLISTRAAPVALELTPDWRVLAFTVCVACAVAILFSLAPALNALRVAPGEAIKGGRQPGAGPRDWRLSKLLVVSQIGFSLLLLAGAALFLRSLGTLMGVDAGVNPANLVVVTVDAPAGEPRGAYYRDLLRRLEAVPGVTSASLSWVPPISDDLGGWWQALGIDGAQPEEGSRESIYFNAVSPGYFETVGTRLVAGREFGWHDGRSAPRVAIVNEALARHLFGGQNPIGRVITMGRNANRADLEIVGLSRDAKYQRLQEETRPIAYLPYEQVPEFTATNNLVAEVRTKTASGPIVGALRQAVRGLNRTSPIAITPLADRIRDSVVRERLIAFVAALLGGFALLLSCGALYGLMSHMVARRTSEIGVRLALGAPRASVMWLIVRDTLQVAVPGAAVGMALAGAGGRIAQRYLFNVSPTDAISLATATTVLLATALLSGYVPARRASRVDPTVALRSE